MKLVVHQHAASLNYIIIYKLYNITKTLNRETVDCFFVRYCDPLRHYYAYFA